MNTLLDEYQKRFKECFPLMLCMGVDDEEIINIIKECLEKNEPYNPELDPDANY